MRVGLLYYSGAGNTECVAGYLAEIWRRDPAIDCRFCAKIGDDNLSEEIVNGCHALLVAYPIHFGDLPQRVVSLLSALPTPGPLVFGLCTYSRSYGGAPRHFAAVLAGRGVRFGGHYSVRMAPTDLLLLTKRGSRRAGRLLRRSEGEIPVLLGRIAGSVVALTAAGGPDRYPAPPERGRHRRAVTGWGERVWRKRLAGRQVLRGRCTRCGICVRACPTENITWQNGYPRFGPDCELCLACVHRCPTEAIQLEGLPREGVRYVPALADNGRVVNLHPCAGGNFRVKDTPDRSAGAALEGPLCTPQNGHGSAPGPGALVSQGGRDQGAVPGPDISSSMPRST